MVASAESILKREKFLDMGLLILMGLPNAISVQQEMDVMYQGFKAATYARGEALLTCKLMIRGRRQEENRRQHRLQVAANGIMVALPQLTPLGIGFEDLAAVVNGEEGDELDMRPLNFLRRKEFFRRGRRLGLYRSRGNVWRTRKFDTSAVKKVETVRLDPLFSTIFQKTTTIWFTWRASEG